MLLSLLCILGDLYLQDRDYFNSMRIYFLASKISDYFNKPSYKIKVYRSMGKLCKLLKKYEHSLKLYKKGLQYAWYTADVNQELQIYEDLGLLYFQN